MSRTILHWQLASPYGVQGWIAGARRLRDHWAGSFLTSWLAGCAMKALRERGIGTVLFPTLDGDPLWQAMHDPASTWFVGTLPNRFQAEISDPDAFTDGSGDVCTRAVRENWNRLAEAVWETFVAPVADDDRNTRGIWDRQIRDFWETTWVLGGDPGDGSDGSWLDRRKNWRTHVATPEEPGDHCRIFGELQELSGRIRARGEGGGQKKFWDALAQRIRDVVQKGTREGAFELLELRPSERLSAPALVKRLFPCLPAGTLKEVFGWIPQGLQKGGGIDAPAAIRFWPSTAYMAAVPWMVSAWRTVPDACATFALHVEGLDHVRAVAERDSYVRALEGAEAFGVIDGQLLFDEALETEIRNAEREGHSNRKRDLEEIRKALRELLRAYRSKVAPQRRGRRVERFTPSPFYALLLMDGDSIGRLLNEAARAGAEADVSEALAAFGRKVPEIVGAHDGALVYAGGDDVQAFLPLTRAIPCAVRLHDLYIEAMARVRAKVPQASTTISAALVFAHYHVPLRTVIREAHELLDGVAKDGNGRDSIAMAVRKPSGTAAVFVTAFCRNVPAVHALARAYAEEAERSTSFLYNVRDRYEAALHHFETRPHDLEKLLLAEWLMGGKEPTDADRRRVRELMDACWSCPGPELAKKGGRCRFDISAGLIARFLADQGVGTLDAEARP